MRHPCFAFALAFIGTLLPGCESFETTYVGAPQPGARFSGVPVVVDRPQFVKVSEKTVRYALVGKELARDTEPEPTPTTDPATGLPVAPSTAPGVRTNSKPLSLGEHSVSEITFELVSVPELYAVDIKRPANGTAKNSIEFEPGQQFPKKYSLEVEDKTIGAVGDLVAKLAEAAKTFKPASGGEGSETEAVRLGETVTRVRIYRIQDFLAAVGPGQRVTPVFDSAPQ